MVIEFQHSFLSRDERESREIFYQKMVWVVDGRRRKRDRAHFFGALGTAARVVELKPLKFLFPSDAGALLRDWAASRAPVFFDFGNLSEPGDPLPFDEPVLWRLNPGSSNGRAYVSPVLKRLFLHAYLKGQPLKGMDYSALAPHLRFLLQQAPQSRWAISFGQYMAKARSQRRRF
jgi:competence protein CoiA